MTQAISDLARAFFDAIEKGDIDTVAATYADDAVIWHNTDRQGSSKAENLKVLAGFIKAVPTRRYEERRLIATADGFTQQHLLVAQRADGKRVELPACIVCAVNGGKITRLDEYFDSAHLAAFTAAG
jgi:ketosteroid isomerase-like protein